MGMFEESGEVAPATLYRVHIMYVADGMIRPLSFRNQLRAKGVQMAVDVTSSIVESAYASGFRVLSWSAEDRDMVVERKITDG